MTGTPFKPAWWLPNSHLQTLWPALLRADIKSLRFERERIELPDGDFVDLDWLGKNQVGPLVLILHGFEGSIESHYAKGMMQAIRAQGWRGVFMHFRGCSGEPNRLPRGYHSGDTTDVSYIVNLLVEREPRTRLAAIGYSLGGNILLKWLGESKNNNPLQAAIAISVPFELHKAAERLKSGFSRLYEWYLVKCARERLLQKFERVPIPLDPAQISSVYDMRDFDDKYTVPIHGFESVDEYYEKSSSRQYLHSIVVPTLVLHAKDDPFMTEDVIPTAAELSEQVKLEITETGGHVGFVTGSYPWKAEYWLEQRVPEYLREYL